MNLFPLKHLFSPQNIWSSFLAKYREYTSYSYLWITHISIYLLPLFPEFIVSHLSPPAQCKCSFCKDVDIAVAINERFHLLLVVSLV